MQKHTRREFLKKAGFGTMTGFSMFSNEGLAKLSSKHQPDILFIMCLGLVIMFNCYLLCANI